MSDLIDRQAAIDALDKRFDSIPMEQTTEILQLRRDLRHLPSAQPDVPDTNVGDMISRQAAIEAIKSRKTAEQSSAGIMRNAVVDFCIDIVKKLPPVTPKQPGWIPTSQKPPEPFKLVLIQDSCGGYDLSMYIPSRIKPKQYPNGYWGDVDCVDYDYLDVYAWYPLPKEYRPEGEEQ